MIEIPTEEVFAFDFLAGVVFLVVDFLIAITILF
jgi:hypothetical protein